jgi:hypothetical protein
MIGLLRLFFSLLASPFKSKSQLEAENAALRHQLIVDAPTLAQGGLSLLLTLEVALPGRATADRNGAAPVDPADERRKFALGAPRIHGELLKLGFEVAQSSVAKYMVKRRGTPPRGPAVV